MPSGTQMRMTMKKIVKTKKKLIDSLTLYTEKFDGDVTKNRETFIGGSDVGTILGVNPWKSAYTLYLEKTGQIERENIDDKLQIRLGHKLESVVAELYEEETGTKVVNSNKSYRVKEYPFLIGHIDRKLVGKKKGLEIKTTSSYNKTDYENGEVPPHYYYQCMFYMMVTGIHDWDLATLRDNRQFYVTHIKWDKEQAEYMLKKILEFWSCVESKNWTLPIDNSQSTIDSLNEIDVPEDEEKALITLYEKDMPVKLGDYEAIQAQSKQLDDFIKTVQNTIKNAMQGSEHAVLGDYEITYKQYKKKGTVDIEKFKKDHPKTDIEKYRKPSTKYRRFIMKKVGANSE